MNSLAAETTPTFILFRVNGKCLTRNLKTEPFIVFGVYGTIHSKENER